MLKRLALVALILVSSILLFVWLMPVNWLSPLLGDDVAVLSGSRVYEGSAIVKGEQTVQWRWCPAEGLTAVCTTVNGGGRFLKTEIHPGLSGLEARNMTFAGLPVREMGLRSLGPATIEGSVESVSMPWREPCLADLITMRGRLGASRLGFPHLEGRTLWVDIDGDGVEGVAIRGEDVWGDFQLVDGMMQGTLTLSGKIVPSEARKFLIPTEAGYGLEISQRMPCQDNG